MSNGASVVLQIDDASNLGFSVLGTKPFVCIGLAPSFSLHVAVNQIPALCALLQSAVPAPVEERNDAIRGAT